MLQRVVGCVMRAELGIEISQDPDANDVGHRVILLDTGRIQCCRKVSRRVTGVHCLKFGAEKPIQKALGESSSKVRRIAIHHGERKPGAGQEFKFGVSVDRMPIQALKQRLHPRGFSGQNQVSRICR